MCQGVGRDRTVGTVGVVPEVAVLTLAELTTLRLGGPVGRLARADSAPELVAAIRAADAGDEPVLLVGGGSNLVVADEGWSGVTVLIRTEGIDVRRDGGDVLLRVAAGADWDSLVARAVAEGWAGIECLSGIPGMTGATPVQNVGAYGQDVAQTLTDVTVWDRSAGRIDVLSTVDCALGYRTSRFKHSERFVVLDVGFRLPVSPLSKPIAYAELAGRLDVHTGAQVPLADVRDAVLELRRGKGMVLDPADHDTWSAGSFFTNPILDTTELTAFERRLPPGSPYPSWPDESGTKLSAAWLIERSGFGRGYGDGPVRLSTKHTLALTNRGTARTSDLLTLARTVRDSTRTRFGVELSPEPKFVNCTL
ncbi:MAG: UDP-N-acetylmuramate dehydrogenase [Geodermatophilaceae bacterium]|nr:UDP-N-acetylmuramate dehydrogenase [Geodermatophilaceae bacterium]